jgi:polyribonucleotide nucleotidyltransferase
MIGERELSIEIGKLAKQAHGIRAGPLRRHRSAGDRVRGRQAQRRHRLLSTYSGLSRKLLRSGKIPGGFFKREGKPSEREVLNSRHDDRRCGRFLTTVSNMKRR